MREHVRAYSNQTEDRKAAAVQRAALRANTRLSQSEREAIRTALVRQAGAFRCFYCKAPLQLASFHIDHKEPVIKGGANTISNYALACVQCNQEKHNKGLAEYRTWRSRNGLPVLF